MQQSQVRKKIVLTLFNGKMSSLMAFFISSSAPVWSIYREINLLVQNLAYVWSWKLQTQVISPFGWISKENFHKLRRQCRNAEVVRSGEKALKYSHPPEFMQRFQPSIKASSSLEDKFWKSLPFKDDREKVNLKNALRATPKTKLSRPFCFVWITTSVMPTFRGNRLFFFDVFGGSSLFVPIFRANIWKVSPLHRTSICSALQVPKVVKFLVRYISK